jgi:carbohydrate diacid regulator
VTDNLVRAAAGLHIHRNTLLYRLEKISQLAGTPAREPRACLSLSRVRGRPARRWRR